VLPCWDEFGVPASRPYATKFAKTLNSKVLHDGVVIGFAGIKGDSLDAASNRDPLLRRGRVIDVKACRPIERVGEGSAYFGGRQP